MRRTVYMRGLSLILAVLLCLPLFHLGGGAANKVHAVSKNQQNIIDRADWYYGITWVAQDDLAGWNGDFVKGNIYRIPYGLPINSGKYIGFGVTFEEFVKAAADEDSIFYKETSSFDGHTTPYYAADAASFVCFCWNISRVTTSGLTGVATSQGTLTEERIKTVLQLGDALNIPGKHVALVTKLGRNSSGVINQIEITEQTAPQIKRYLFTPAELVKEYANYTILRYTGDVPEAPEKLPCHGTEEQASWIEEACFDVMVYRDRYPDLTGLNDEQLKEHWLTNGINEGRSASIILDLSYYLEQNPDLKSAFGKDYRAAYNHFVSSGYHEHRASSMLFDANYYLKNNKNLYISVGEDYMLHYLQYGVKEGLRASKTYDPAYYQKIRPDVAAAWPNDYLMAARHYAGHGIKGKVVGYDNKGPTISDVVVSNVTAAGYTVTCKVVDIMAVSKVVFPTWTLLNDQDDLIPDWNETQLGTKNGDIYTFRVKSSDHKNEIGYYVTHIYAYDKEGNKTAKALDLVNVIDPAPETATNIILHANSNYTIQKGLVLNVKPATTVSALLRQFANPTLKVMDQEGNEITGDRQVSTGVAVALYTQGKLMDAVTVVVRGDLDGDGKVDTTDYMRIKALLYSDIKPVDVIGAAADVDGNGSVDTTDYMRVKAHFLGKFTLHP